MTIAASPETPPATTPSRNTVAAFRDHVLQVLESARGIHIVSQDVKDESISSILAGIATILRSISKEREANALEDALYKVTASLSLGGLGLTDDSVPSSSQYTEALFLVEAWLESLKSQEQSNSFLSFNINSSHGILPMTLSQKIFAQHILGHLPAGGLAVGDVARVGVDWILASELSWSGMSRIHEDLGSPGVWRNDRLWIAGDHVVHPTINHTPKIKTYVVAAEKAKKDFKMTEYQGMNYTIMHTEFVRERAQPGMLAFGSDSHTCSAGAVGCLSIGLGTADVMMTLALGETWFKVPEAIFIEFVGKPSLAISGKDVILHILKELKRNTVAAERIVEFAGEGARYLSSDARFAICNMCTEFGAITGVFVPDEVTQEYINRRKRSTYRSSSLYFKPDHDAVYAGKYQIDLSAVEPSIAVYPEPDHVVPISEKAGTPLDGVFIGACTTTEEELVLAALVLKVGLDKKLPLAKGKRHYVPGSLPIVQKLQDLGLLEIYEEAGFTRGPPGCSLCVGLSAEKALEGETWLSSQNRNFKNRMGMGSIGHVTSAIVCAASAFSMSITDTAPFLKELDEDFLRRYKSIRDTATQPVQYVEPKPNLHSEIKSLRSEASQTFTPTVPASGEHTTDLIESKVVTLGDFIDTDALAPGPTLTTCITDEEFGAHVLEHTHPEFRSTVAQGHQVVVAGHAFGVGSSREMAVSALKGAGVRAVIARSFAFIFSRNQPSLGLLGINIGDEAFFEAARDGEAIAIDVPRRVIRVAQRDFPFQLSEIEYQLTRNHGIASSYRMYGKAIWEKLTATTDDEKLHVAQETGNFAGDGRLDW
ncbi:hypothetical protein FH972_024399 [Carpinus fangiana]|uniref:Aconitase/3-isopropylmalate dehydratase large subunit alpha/beta/alpha domain-containing protein n=1 Tax=Carpinus fangiana TaxID=176857 RepID=A0A5N6KY83_9ROSI|nr:hypothetical protein FH972_024399 [Carpinus fangiana]